MGKKRQGSKRPEATPPNWITVCKQAQFRQNLYKWLERQRAFNPGEGITGVEVRDSAERAGLEDRPIEVLDALREAFEGETLAFGWCPRPGGREIPVLASGRFPWADLRKVFIRAWDKTGLFWHTMERLRVHLPDAPKSSGAESGSPSEKPNALGREWLTVHEVAALARVSPYQVRAEVYRERLRRARPRVHSGFARADVESWLERRGQSFVKRNQEDSASSI